MSKGTLPLLSPSVVARKRPGATSEQGGDHAGAAATGPAGGHLPVHSGTRVRLTLAEAARQREVANSGIGKAVARAE